MLLGLLLTCLSLLPLQAAQRPQLRWYMGTTANGILSWESIAPRRLQANDLYRVDISLPATDVPMVLHGIHVRQYALYNAQGHLLKQDSLVSDRIVLPTHMQPQAYRLIFRSYTKAYQGYIGQPGLLPMDAFLAQEKAHHIGHGIFSGILLSLACCQLLLFLLAQQRAHLYFFLFLIGLGICDLNFHGLLDRLLWPQAPQYDLLLFLTVGSLTRICLLLFLGAYLPHMGTALRIFRKTLLGVHLLPIALLPLLWPFPELLYPFAQGWKLLGLGLMVFLIWSGLAGLRNLHTLPKKMRMRMRIFCLAICLFPLTNIAYLLQILRHASPFSLGYLPVQISLLSYTLTICWVLIPTYRSLQRTVRQQAEARRLLERHNRRKHHFFSLLANDLKTPLLSIDAFFNLHLRYGETLPLPQQRSLRDNAMLVLATGQLQHMLENLLAWARHEQRHPKPQAVRLSDLVGRQCERLPPLIKKKKAALHADVPERYYVWADPQVLDMILHNLLHNALRHTPPGGLVYLGCRQEGGKVQLLVSDEGPGLPPEAASRLEGPCPDLDIPLQQRQKGFGLGLPLCQYYLGRMDSGLQLLPGKGCSLQFPLRIASRAAFPLAMLLVGLFTMLPLSQLQATTGQPDSCQLQTQYRWLPDSLGTLDWQQAAHRLQSGAGLPLDTPLYQVGVAPMQYWALVEIQATPHTHLMLQMAPWARAYCRQLPDGLLLGISGYLLPMSQRHYAPHPSTFGLQVPASGKLQLLLHAQLDHGFYTLVPSGIWVCLPSEYQAWEQWQWFWQGVFLACAVLLMLYHSSFYLATSDKAYGLYVLSMLGIILYDLGINELLTRWLWPENITMGRYWFSLLICPTSVFQLLAAAAYLQIRKRAPRLLLPLRLLISLHTGILLFTLWAYAQTTDWSRTISDAMQIAGMASQLFLLGTSFYSLWLAKRQKTPIWKQISWVLIGANSWVMLGATLLILQAQQVQLPIPISNPEILKICLGAQAITLSLGLMVRYRQLQQEEQRQQQAHLELEEVGHLKDRLFSVIAHDMKSPLSSLDSYFELMLRYPLPEEQQLALTQQADRSVKLMSLLLENLLAWSRNQMLQAPYRPEQLNLIDLGKRNLELLAPLAEHKGIKLNSYIGALPCVFGDMGMIDFALRNLLHNAIKYTPEGGEIWLYMQAKERRVRIAVVDQGIGIAPELLAELRTRQGHISTPGTGQEKGSGLGLMLCRKFLRWHDAQLYIHSIPGKGSSFSFWLQGCESCSYTHSPKQPPL